MFIKFRLFLERQLSLLSFDEIFLAENEINSLESSLLKTRESLTFDPVLHLSDLDGVSNLIHSNTDYLATFLVYFSHELQRNGSLELSWRVFGLNKALNSLNVSPSFRVPNHLRISHSVGTVIGKAQIGDYFFIGHGCTVGASGVEQYPVLGNRVSLRANSSVLGNSILGDNVMIGSGVRLINENVPDNTIVVLDKGELKHVQSKHALEWNIKIFNEI